MKPVLSREHWLAIFEDAISQQGAAGIEAQWLVAQRLGLEPDDFPGIHAALEQGRWRGAKYPRAYIKRVAHREAARMRAPLDPHVVSFDVVAGEDGSSHEAVADHITFANGTSTAVRCGDGVWKPGGHGDDYDLDYDDEGEPITLRTRLLAKLPKSLKMSIEPSDEDKRDIDAFNASNNEYHIHPRPFIRPDMQKWADLAGFDEWEKAVLDYRSEGYSRDVALALQSDEASRKKLQAAWKRFDRTGKHRLREAAEKYLEKNVPKGVSQHTR